MATETEITTALLAHVAQGELYIFTVLFHLFLIAFSALTCWLGGRKGIRPVKTEW